MTGETVVAHVDDRNTNGNQAAERFAREHWEQPRNIAGWVGPYFYLENGTVWYRVRDADDCWEIVRTKKPV